MGHEIYPSVRIFLSVFSCNSKKMVVVVLMLKTGWKEPINTKGHYKCKSMCIYTFIYETFPTLKLERAKSLG